MARQAQIYADEAGGISTKRAKRDADVLRREAVKRI
jgi:hypothetical protein